jgi:hypothetical protein
VYIPAVQQPPSAAAAVHKHDILQLLVLSLLMQMHTRVLLSLQASMRNSLLQQYAVRLFEGQLHNVGELIGTPATQTILQVLIKQCLATGSAGS